MEPVPPELPLKATGADMDPETESPVLPEFVALDCDTAFPELPLAADGFTTTVVFPPAPPLAEPIATLEPPMAVPGPLLTAEPPGPAVTAVTVPADPPLPPTARMPTLLMALPVLPDRALASE